MALELVEREIRTSLTADGSVYDNVLREGERQALRFKQNVGSSFQGLARDTNAFSEATRNGAGHMLKYVSTGAALSGALSSVGVSTGIASRGVSILTTALSGAVGPIGWVVAGLAGLGLTIKEITDDQRGLREETEKATQALINQASKSGARTVGEGEDLSKRYRGDITKRGEYEQEIKRLEDQRRNLGFFDQFKLEPITREIGKWRGLLTGVNTELDLMNDALEKAGLGTRQHPMDIGLKAIEATAKRIQKPEAYHLQPWEMPESAMNTYTQPGVALPGMQNMLRGAGNYPSLAAGMMKTDDPKYAQDLIPFDEKHYDTIKQAQLDTIERTQRLQRAGTTAYDAINKSMAKYTDLNKLSLGLLQSIAAGYKAAAAAYIEELGKTAAIKAIMEAAEALGALARLDFASAGLHAAASAKYMVVAAAASVGASLIRNDAGLDVKAPNYEQSSGGGSGGSGSGYSSGPNTRLLTAGSVETAGTYNYYVSISFNGPTVYNNQGMYQLAEDLMGYIRDANEGGRLGVAPRR